MCRSCSYEKQVQGFEPKQEIQRFEYPVKMNQQRTIVQESVFLTPGGDRLGTAQPKPQMSPLQPSELSCSQLQVSQNTANQFHFSCSSAGYQSGQKMPATSAFYRQPVSKEERLMSGCSGNRKRLAKLLGKSSEPRQSTAQKQFRADQSKQRDQFPGQSQGSIQMKQQHTFIQLQSQFHFL